MGYLPNYPHAVWKPLGSQTEPLITPKCLTFHTMSGYLQGTFSMFSQQGYTGTESHFGVGGPWDGESLDGVVWQFQDINHQADAQYDGNAYCVSVETSDGGDSTRPWSSKQVQALVDLGKWFVARTGNPAVLVSAPGKRGLGYHSQFTSAWNRDEHACPGKSRQAQLTGTIIPVVANSTMIQSGAHGPLVGTLQSALRLTVTSTFDAATVSAVKNFQAVHHLGVDGVVGPKTWAALNV